MSRIRMQSCQALETSVSRGVLKAEISSGEALVSLGSYGHTLCLKSAQCFSEANRDPLEALPSH